MIEAIVGVWLGCVALSLLTVGIGFYFTRRKLHSQKLKNLNANLEKVGMYWSNSAGDFSTLTPSAVAQDAKRALRNALLVGLLGLASIPGFILLLLVIVSVHVLARSRKEIATFRSALTSDPSLSKEGVEALVQEFKKIY